MKPATRKFGKMSRTYRRRNAHDEYWYTRWYFKLDSSKSLEYYIAKYQSDSCHTMHQCPSWFKRSLRKGYRRQCKQMIENAKAGNIEYDDISFPIPYKNALWYWW